MSIKLNSFILSDKLINRMKETFLESWNLGIEAGFDLCQKKNGDIVDRNLCTGTECEIRLKSKCPINEKFVGNFHTHPDAFDTLPSENDLANSYGTGISCIADQWEINCYLRKNRYDIDTHRKIRGMTSETQTVEEGREKRKEVLNKYFNKTKITKGECVYDW